MTAAWLALALLAPWAKAPVEYERYELHELVLCADVVVSGEIMAVHRKTFDLGVELRIAGDDPPLRIAVQRFTNWTCASRWTTYERGQRVLLFLKRQGPDGYRILGAGGEGEMPIVGSDVVVRGYRLSGGGAEVHPVGDAQVRGARAALADVVAAIQGLREVLEWKPDELGQVVSVRPKAGMGEALHFARSSRTALDLFEAARSSRAWQGPVETEGEEIPVESPARISALALGLTGVPRTKPRREPDPFDSDWSGFGGSVAFVGDVDGDGISDLAAGAPSDRILGLSRGALWILFLDAEGRVRSHAEISEGVGGFPAALNESAALGQSLAPLGDLDGDGVPDLVVGAPGWKARQRGGVWILFLARDGSVARALELGALDALHEAVADAEHGLGKSLANLGDLDGDGLPELAIGEDPSFDFGRKNGRGVWVLSLERSGGVRWVRRIHDRADGFAGESSWFGDALAGIGDLDGNGVPDLAVANTYDPDGGEARGAVWIVFLRSDGSIAARQKISDWEGGLDALLRGWERFGRVLAGPGDLDGDGHVDLLVGSLTGLWTLFLNADGTVRERRLTRSPTDPEGAVIGFTISAACPVPPAGGGAVPLFLGLVLGERGRRDALLGQFTLGRHGALRIR